MIIGISGKSGSGKSVISRYLAKKLHYHYVDVDKLSREIRDSNVSEIVNLMGTDSFVIEGKIDSKLLGEVLFNSRELMSKYNEFIYSKQVKCLDKLSGNLVLDTMFLPIMEIFDKCDTKILVKCDEKVRYNRILNRDKISNEYFKIRDRFSLEYKESDFDYIVINNYKYKEEIDKILESMVNK